LRAPKRRTDEQVSGHGRAASNKRKTKSAIVARRA